MSVDNRYTGVGYEPPFETPSDKDFMAAHIETLESRVRELEAEIKKLQNWGLDKIKAHDAVVDSLRKNKDQTINGLEAERDIYKSGARCPHCDELRLEVGETANLYREQRDDNIELRARHAALVEEASWALNYIRGDLEPHAYSTIEYITSIKKLKAALAEVK